jgi:glycosyltransferase involved in cell wall biosynthesis
MKKTYLLKKLGYALMQLPKAFSTTRTPRLIMTLLVKDEEDILEDNLIFHKYMGVDYFIVTDNNSTDRTPDILQKYRQMGWIKEIIEEHSTDYSQKEWVDRMVWRAKSRYHAEWVINADADELWYSPVGSLKSELIDTHANVLLCDIKNVYPEENRVLTRWNRMVNPVDDKGQYELSPFSLFESQRHKVIHRTAGYLQIGKGNHKVIMFPRHKQESNIRIYHYNIRGKQHFMHKMINGGQQCENNKSRHGARHWRYFYSLYKEGRLEMIYEDVIGSPHYKELQRAGYIYIDNTIPDTFKRIFQQRKKS